VDELCFIFEKVPTEMIEMKISQPGDLEPRSLAVSNIGQNDVPNTQENGVLDNQEISNILGQRKKGPHIGVVGKGNGSLYNFSQSTSFDGCYERVVPASAISRHKKHSLMQAMRRSLSEVS